MKKALLVLSMALMAYLYVFSGIGYSVPSKSRVERMVSPAMDTAQLYAGMAGAREYVYKDSKNHLAASPWKRTDEFRIHPRVEVDYPRQGGSFFFYNYLRHYYLCGDDPDESGVLNGLGNLKPAKLQFNPHYTSYGGGYFYTLAVYLKGLSLLGAIKLVPDMKYYFANPDEMGKLYTAARSHSALLGTLGILLLAYLVYRRTSSALWSLVAAALLFSCPTVIVVSKSMKPHLIAMTLGVVVLVLVNKYLSGKDFRYLLAALAACGLAAGTVIYSGVLALYPILAYAQARERNRPVSATLKELAQGFGLVVAAFLVLNPYWLLEPKEVADNLMTAGHGALVSLAWETPLVFARYCLGIVPSVVFVLLAGYNFLNWKEAPPQRKALLQFLLAMIVFMGSVSPLLPANMRFLVFIAPLYLFFVVDSVSGIKTAGKFIPAAAALTALLSLYSALAYRSYFVSASNDATDTKMRAGAWIDENLRGASLGHTMDLIPFDFPPLRLAEHKVVVYRDPAELVADKDQPDYVVGTGGLLFLSSPEEKEKFFKAYTQVMEFAHPGKALPDSWSIMPANITVYIYKKL